MDPLLDVIRAATATDATAEQKAAGVQACRTIAAALDTEPGKPLVLPGVPTASPLAGIRLDQLLDLAIARLSVVANTRDADEAARATRAQAAKTELRIPMAPTPVAPRVARKPAPPGRTRTAVRATRSNTTRPSPTRKP